MRRPNSKTFAAALAAIVLAAAPPGAAAQSKSHAYRADLAETTTKTEVRAGGTVWQCRGKHCVANARGGNVTVRGCTQLARQVGRVVEYRSDIKRLADDQLAACNAEATAGPRPPAATAAAAAGKPATPARKARVSTDELTFTGVHAPAGSGRQ